MGAAAVLLDAGAGAMYSVTGAGAAYTAGAGAALSMVALERCSRILNSIEEATRSSAVHVSSGANRRAQLDARQWPSSCKYHLKSVENAMELPNPN